VKEILVKAERTRRKSPHLDPQKLERLKTVLGAPSEAEALEQAVDLLLAEEDIRTMLRKVKGKARIARVFT